MFSSRRKTIENNLNVINNPESILKELGLNELVRPEEIPIETYIRMYKLLEG